MQKWIGLAGIAVILGIGFLLSSHKKSLNFRTLIVGFAMQLMLALMVLRADWISGWMAWLPLSASAAWWAFVAQVVVIVFIGRASFLRPLAEKIPMRPIRYFLSIEFFLLLIKFNSLKVFFEKMREFVAHLLSYTSAGATFVFGPLATKTDSWGIIFAFYVLPTIIFVSSVFAVLYYLGIMQVVVKLLARIMSRLLAASGAESLSVAANVFMGQTEAPLTIRPYLATMTQSELFTLMVSGMAHVSGSIMVAYVAIAGVDITHLLTAVIMTAPGAIMMAKLILPETETPQTRGTVTIDIPIHDVNVIDAAARGASEGMQLAINVAAMLIAFIALVALVNGIFDFAHSGLNVLATMAQGNSSGPILASLSQHFPATLEQLLGWIFSPLAYVMGFPLKDVETIGNLLGTRMVLNEFVAFINLAPLKASLDPKSFVMATYALCGFANLSSIAIQVGGIGALVPNRRHDLARLGLRAVIAGTLANFMTATIVGLLY